MVVRIVRDLGPVPTITARDGEAHIRRDEYRAACAMLRAELDPLLDRRAAGHYLGASEFRRMRALQQTNGKTHTLRDHRARMRAFLAVGIRPSLDTPPVNQAPIAPVTARAQMALFR